MQILFDTHVHTLASGHAYSTIHECMQMAKSKGLEGIGITDHAKTLVPGNPGVLPHLFNLKVIPPYVEGVRVLRGVEVDILDLGGGLAIPDSLFEQLKLDLVIASVHPDVPIGKPWETKQQHTEAYKAVLNSPYVDIIGHSGLVDFEYYHDEVLLEAKRLDKMIEINNSSHTVRPLSRDNCRDIARRCKELGVYIAVGSDAHACYTVGEFGHVLEMLKEVDFPQELVANATWARFAQIVNRRKNLVV